MGALSDMIRRQEGRRLLPYLDCCGLSWRFCKCVVKGNLTIADGRNLDANGVSNAEADIMRENDIQRALVDCVRSFSWFKRLSPTRQDVVTGMVYQLGLQKFLGFKRTITALGAGDYREAAAEMLDSKWATQCPSRAKELAAMMVSDSYQ